MNRIRVSIVGASGYSGEELLRILRKHPAATISAITSRQHAGKDVASVFPRFAQSGLVFCEPRIDALQDSSDVVFLALPHGVACEYAAPLVAAGVRVIDISADFRLRDVSAYEQYYGRKHAAPELLAQSVYGLPELYREQLADASLVACPGCYPTSIILPTAPLLARQLVSLEGIVACSMSGVSGAGRKIDLPYLFPECSESVRPYSVVGHRHLPEIEQELARSAGVASLAVNFIPHLVPVNRGIHSTIVLKAKAGASEAGLLAAVEERYGSERFVRILPPGELADTKHVSFTNVAEIGFRLDRHSGNVIVSSAIDNLTKGASGQAVQCMNLMFGRPEDEGLGLLG
jgi:N-acetyl-gamma-glutamyl-phosphate reductase